MSCTSYLSKWGFWWRKVWFLRGGCSFVCSYYLCFLLCWSGLSLSLISFSMLLQFISLCIMHEKCSIRIFHKINNPVANHRRELSRMGTWKNIISSCVLKGRGGCVCGEAHICINICKNVSLAQKVLVSWVNVCWLFCRIAASGEGVLFRGAKWHHLIIVN